VGYGGGKPAKIPGTKAIPMPKQSGKPKRKKPKKAVKKA